MKLRKYHKHSLYAFIISTSLVAVIIYSSLLINHQIEFPRLVQMININMVTNDTGAGTTTKATTTKTTATSTKKRASTVGTKPPPTPTASVSTITRTEKDEDINGNSLNTTITTTVSTTIDQLGNKTTKTEITEVPTSVKSTTPPLSTKTTITKQETAGSTTPKITAVSEKIATPVKSSTNSKSTNATPDSTSAPTKADTWYNEPAITPVVMTDANTGAMVTNTDYQKSLASGKTPSVVYSYTETAKSGDVTTVTESNDHNQVVKETVKPEGNKIIEKISVTPIDNKAGNYYRTVSTTVKDKSGTTISENKKTTLTKTETTLQKTNTGIIETKTITTTDTDTGATIDKVSVNTSPVTKTGNPFWNQVKDKLNNSPELQGLGTNGLGGGNAPMVTPPLSVITSKEPNALQDYYKGAAYSAAAGATTAGGILTGSEILTLAGTGGPVTATSLAQATAAYTGATIATTPVLGFGLSALTLGGTVYSAKECLKDYSSPACAGLIGGFQVDPAGFNQSLSSSLNTYTKPIMYFKSQTIDLEKTTVSLSPGLTENNIYDFPEPKLGTTLIDEQPLTTYQLMKNVKDYNGLSFTVEDYVDEVFATIPDNPQFAVDMLGDTTAQQNLRLPTRLNEFRNGSGIVTLKDGTQVVITEKAGLIATSPVFSGLTVPNTGSCLASQTCYVAIGSNGPQLVIPGSSLPSISLPSIPQIPVGATQ